VANAETAVCAIRRCTAPAAVLVVLDRPTTNAARADHAWTGHLETAYYGEHAIARPDAIGIDKYGDVWTLSPLKEIDRA
jgi:hypothetical protein